MDKFFRIAAIGFVAFAGVFGYLLADRVDRVTVAMLGGVVIGLLVTAPIMLVVGVVLLRLQHRSDAGFASREHYFAPMPPPPPQYWTAPTAAMQVEPPTQLNTTNLWSPSGADRTLAPTFQLPPQRKFYVIGEDGGMAEAY